MLGNLCPFYDNFEIANICRHMQTRIFCVSIGWTMLKYGSKTRSNPTKSHYINPCGFVWRLFIHGREMDNQRHTNAATRILSSYRLIHIMLISIVMGVSRSRHGFFLYQVEKSHLEMDENWGYYFMNPPYGSASKRLQMV